MLPLPLYFHSPPCSSIFQILFDGFHLLPSYLHVKHILVHFTAQCPFLTTVLIQQRDSRFVLESAANLLMSQIYTFCECLNLVKSHEFFYKVITLW
jgi:hypothetical protein